MAQHAPGQLSFAHLHATADEVSSLGGEGEVLATFGCGGPAKWTVPLVHHGWDIARVKRIATNESLVKEKKRKSDAIVT